MDPVTGHAQDYFVENKGTTHGNNSKFLLDEYSTTFRLKNLEDCSHPEALLHKILQSSMAVACENRNVTMLGVRVESSLLKKGPIQVPHRSRKMNSPEAILHAIVKADQSASEESLYGAPMKLVITTIEGRAGSQPKGLIPQNVKPHALINIDNKDTYCLFYALEMSRIY